MQGGILRFKGFRNMFSRNNVLSTDQLHVFTVLTDGNLAAFLLHSLGHYL